MGNIYRYVSSENHGDAYVYFITDNEYIKIGIAKDPQKRINQLQTANPKRLHIYALVHMKDYDSARLLEKELHNKFEEYSIGGEWFLGEPIKKAITRRVITESFDFEGFSYVERM